MTEPRQLQCPYSRTLEEVGDFCLIRDDWVGIQNCGKCPARSRSAPLPKLNYDGNSDACLDCKGYHTDEGNIPPCDTCEFRQREHDATIRNQTLDLIDPIITKARVNCNANLWDTMCGDLKCPLRDKSTQGADFCMLRKLESLRTEAHKQPKEQAP